MCLGSDIRKKPIPDPGPGVPATDPDPQHCLNLLKISLNLKVPDPGSDPKTELNLKKIVKSRFRIQRITNSRSWGLF